MADANQYELTYVISGVLSDQEISKTVKRVNKSIENNDGDIIDVDEWGSQRLAYEIQKKRSGHFVNMYFKAPGPSISRIERTIGIDDNILRHLILRMDPTMKRHYERRRRHDIDPDEAAEEEDEKEGSARDRTHDHLEYVDYKDTEFLQQFINNQGKILPRRVTGESARVQRMLTRAIKRARHLSLLPYVSEAMR